MKKLTLLFLTFLIILTGCAVSGDTADIVATTLPVYDFTVYLCQSTDLEVTQLITESVSCLHDYTLQVSQMKSIEEADLVVISGAGLETFLEDVISDNSHIIDASASIELLCPEDAHLHHHHDHDSHDHHDHSHDSDSHIWLSPANAMVMAGNICEGLCSRYPRYETAFRDNLTHLLEELQLLQKYGEDALGTLSCRELITFHDGFAYFADSFGLTILEAVEEESGSEASAKELIHLIELADEHSLPAIFTEVNGSTSAASVISAETGAKLYSLDMAMAGNGYFDAMYHNIDTIKEALQ